MTVHHEGLFGEICCAKASGQLSTHSHEVFENPGGLLEKLRGNLDSVTAQVHEAGTQRFASRIIVQARYLVELRIGSRHSLSVVRVCPVEGHIHLSFLGPEGNVLLEAAHVSVVYEENFFVLFELLGI